MFQVYEMVEVDISTLSTVVAATSVVIGVVLAVLELRNLVKTRQTDLVIRLYTTMGSKEFQDAWQKFSSLEFSDYNDYVKRYGSLSSENPAHTAIFMVCLYFEGVGELLYRKLIDINMVDDLFTFPIKTGWEKVKLFVESARKQLNAPSLFEWFEYLYNEMEKREQKL